MPLSTYGSLFCGAGLLDLGLHTVVPELACEFGVESDSVRRRLFAEHFTPARMFSTIASAACAELPAVAGLVGGIPCNTHSTPNTAGKRGLSPEWTDAIKIAKAVQPSWTLWESSSKGRAWERWVPFVRADLSTIGHTSVPFLLRTATRGACHDRKRAFVLSWCATADTDGEGQPSRAVHAALASLRKAPVDLWDGRVPARAHGRLDDGAGRDLARAIGYGVDQRTAVDVGRVLKALLCAM